VSWKSDVNRSKWLQHKLEILRDTSILKVVEGAHDVSALAQFGAAPIIKYDSLIRNGMNGDVRVACLMMDSDKGGEEKRVRAESFVHENHPGWKIDASFGPNLLKGMGATSVEQLPGLIAEVLDRKNGEKKRDSKKDR
jgi:5S rRNA maturation endonuclease (ribonuclease M5)